MEAENKYREVGEAPERFPTREEITFEFERILNGQKSSEPKVKSDERGVYFYEVEVVLENGEKEEYNFQRAQYDYKNIGNYPGGKFSASIHLTYYDSEGIPYNGKNVANYLDGVWTYI